MSRLSITSIDQLDPDARYSYADYLTWKFEEMVELINGKIYRNMSPAPGRRHQRIAMNLTYPLVNYFARNPCQFYAAPFDVRLLDRQKSTRQNKDIYTVVQPDLCVICDRSKLDDKGCIGAPDWIIEIVSPATRQKDQRTKLALYEENGVLEYWIVFPEINCIAVYDLGENDRYQLRNLYNEWDIIQVGLFPDLSVEVKAIFDDE